MPCLRRGASSRLSNAPLEWKANFTFPGARDDSEAAAERISRSGTQNQSRVALTVTEAADTVTARAPTLAASARARRREGAESREMISVMM